MPSDIILSVSSIAAVYNPSIAALHDVSLEVARGGITALIGANGAGKSTTLRAVSNLLGALRGRLAAGSIRFDGDDIARLGPAALVRRGLVPVLEGRHCFKSLTVEENLVTGGIGRSASRREIATDLDKVYGVFPRLREKRKAVAGLTSGGEQQMTAIGRALMSRPRLLVLDEPSMGLAPLVVHDIFARLKELNRSEGLSILIAEQNAVMALRFAERAVVLENGITVLAGTAADLRGRNDIKAFYLGQGPIADGAPIEGADARAA